MEKNKPSSWLPSNSFNPPFISNFSLCSSFISQSCIEHYSLINFVLVRSTPSPSADSLTLYLLLLRLGTFPCIYSGTSGLCPDWNIGRVSWLMTFHSTRSSQCVSTSYAFISSLNPSQHNKHICKFIHVRNGKKKIFLYNLVRSEVNFNRHWNFYLTQLVFNSHLLIFHLIILLLRSDWKVIFYRVTRDFVFIFIGLMNHEYLKVHRQFPEIINCVTVFFYYEWW